MMLLGDTSRGALCKKGTDNDKGRASEPPSSCQSDDEPYPQGTWAHQKVLWHVCDVQAVTGTRKDDGCSCQT